MHLIKKKKIINIDKAVTTLYSCIKLTHSWKAKQWQRDCQCIEACTYIEWQQRLCIHAATHIHHTHIQCKDTTQLLHIYMLAWCSKSIDFSHYQIDLHALQSHTLQKHDTVFAHIHRMTVTSLRMRCNSYTSHTHTLRRHDSAFAHLHACMMQ